MLRHAEDGRLLDFGQCELADLPQAEDRVDRRQPRCHLLVHHMLDFAAGVLGRKAWAGCFALVGLLSLHLRLVHVVLQEGPDGGQVGVLGLPALDLCSAGLNMDQVETDYLAVHYGLRSEDKSFGKVGEKDAISAPMDLRQQVLPVDSGGLPGVASSDTVSQV